MNDDMYEGEGWKRRIGGQWACGYRNIEHDGECRVHGTNWTGLHGYRHVEGVHLKCTWKTDEWCGECA